MKAILNFLRTITPPRMVREAMALYGTKEVSGSANNPIIVNWAKETTIKADDWYNADSIPWCSLAMAVVAQRAKWDISKIDLRALSWLEFGVEVPISEGALGDVAVFVRKGGGHVGVMIGWTKDKKFIYVLGGNQGDQFNISKFPISRLKSFRRPPYNIRPDTSKQYFFDDMGAVSTNEQ